MTQIQPRDSLAVPPEIRTALAILSRAATYAADLRCDPWDFAVEVSQLSAAGVTYTDLRWLSLKGYVEQSREVGLPGEEKRSFRHCRAHTLSRRSCFILTPDGIEFTRQLQAIPVPVPERVVRGRASISPLRRNARLHVRPLWDHDRHELRLGDELIKCFKIPSPNQELILNTFQEEGWPARIDDPLPPLGESDPKRRLQDTIKSLNRCQKAAVIRFSGDGTGEGVLWQLI